MDNTGGAKSSSSLVVADRRSQRDGGCAGIFSQLMDWKRKFAKKLFFSRKVLPLARSKQTSKKLGGHGKSHSSKLLISGENRGAFSKKIGEKRLQKHEMRSASLVARLMGLESMPVLHQVKPKNKAHFGRDDKFVSELSESEDIKNTQLSPQNAHKPGISGRPPVSRFGYDALQLRGVLRKHRSELSSPASPGRTAGKRTSSRLIGAATRILDPGMQAKKNAIAYSNHNPGIQPEFMMTDEKPVRIPEQFSCKACGNVLGMTGLQLDVEKEQSSSSCSLSAEFTEQEELDPDFLCEAVALGEEQIVVNPRNFQHASSSIDLQHRMTHPQITVDNNRMPISKNRPCVPNKQHRSKMETEKKYCIKQDDSYRALVRKRGPSTIDKQVVNPSPTRSVYKQGLNSWLAPDENDRNVRFQKQLVQVGDGLGELLQHKLKMLSYQEWGELEENPLQRSTAIILQELVSALCEEITISRDDKMTANELKGGSCPLSPNHDVFRAEGDTNNFAKEIRFRNNNHILSPESVLEASFSNDSCFSTSSSGKRPHTQEADLDLLNTHEPNLDLLNSRDPNLDILDSASSLDKTRTGFQMVSHILNQICKENASLTASNLQFAKEIIITAELLFGTKDILIFPLLIHEAESVFHEISDTSYSSRNQIRSFVADYVVEYLDRKCSSILWHCCRGRSELDLGVERMVFEAGREIGRWRKDGDHITEGEICGCLEEWRDFEIEGFEIGCAIGGSLVMSLVDEIVVDFMNCHHLF